jgi:hypothetical protein
MTWDLGPWGVTVLVAISLGFGLLAAVLAGGGAARRLWVAAVTTVACVVVGLFTSEGLFGWATQEDLQPNVDGLSRDEVLLSSLLTTAVVVVVALLRRRARHGQLTPERRARVP